MLLFITYLCPKRVEAIHNKFTASQLDREAQDSFFQIRDYYQQLYANNMDNVEEMDKFLEKYNFPKLDQGRNRKS